MPRPDRTTSPRFGDATGIMWVALQWSAQHYCSLHVFLDCDRTRLRAFPSSEAARIILAQVFSPKYTTHWTIWKKLSLLWPSQRGSVPASVRCSPEESRWAEWRGGSAGWGWRRATDGVNAYFLLPRDPPRCQDPVDKSASQNTEMGSPWGPSFTSRNNSSRESSRTNADPPTWILEMVLKSKECRFNQFFKSRGLLLLPPLHPPPTYNSP